MLQIYWPIIKWFFVAVFVIAAVQSGLIYIGIYAPLAIDPLGVAKVLVVIGCVWQAVRKSNSTPQQAFTYGAVLFIPTLLFIVTGFICPKLPQDMGVLLKVLSSFVFVTFNFLLYGFIGLLTAVVAKKNTAV